MKLKEQYITKSSDNRLHQASKPIIGLTGGIGSGKSSVAKLFSKAGITVIDADEIVHDVYESDEALEFVRQINPEIVASGEIDFQKLREVAFATPDILKQLEEFVYARMPKFFKEQVKAATSDFIVYDVPLLFEKNLNELCDVSLCVYTSVDNQINRTMQRDFTPKDVIEQIIAKQMPLKEKASASDFVLINDGAIKDLEKVFDLLLNDLCN